MRTYATSVRNDHVYVIPQNFLEGILDRSVQIDLKRAFDRVHETDILNKGVSSLSPAEMTAWDMLQHFVTEARESFLKRDDKSSRSTLPVNTGHVSVCLNTGAVAIFLIREKSNYGDERHAGNDVGW